MTCVVTTGFPAQCFDSFFRYDWNHDQCSNRIGHHPESLKQILRKFQVMTEPTFLLDGWRKPQDIVCCEIGRPSRTKHKPDGFGKPSIANGFVQYRLRFSQLTVHRTDIYIVVYLQNVSGPARRCPPVKGTIGFGSAPTSIGASFSTVPSSLTFTAFSLFGGTGQMNTSMPWSG